MISDGDAVERYEVVVAGAGPVGLSTGLFLADRGIRVLVVDRRDPLAGPPRANTSVRTLELFRSIGIGDADLDRLGWDGPSPLRSMVKDSAVGAVRYRAEPPAPYAEWLETCSPVGIRRTMTQYEVQRLALDHLRRRGGHVRFGVELVDAAEDAGTVRTRVVDTGTGRDEPLVSRYLVGADGAHSTVRELAGIDAPERQVAARLNTAFFRADLGRVFPESATHACLIRNDHVHCTLFAKGAAGDRWSSHILDFPGKPAELAPLGPERTLRLLRAAIGDDTVPIDLVECNAWEAATGIAPAFRRGRILLAGDAAHVQSSAGGLGMNTGIQDGHNLAWKLAAVLRGQADESLLDSYEPERRAAAEASLAVSHAMHRVYQARPPAAELHARLAADYLRGMLLYHYDSGAVRPDADAGPDAPHDLAVPGRRLPHRRLTGAEHPRSTLDLLGRGWTLLVGPDGADWLTVDADGLDLRVRQITPAMTGGDAAAFGALSGTGPAGALLVRPDGFVAWRSPGAPPDPPGAVRSVLRVLHGRR